MSIEVKIPVNISAPYYIEGSVTDNTEELWLVFHGYGQLARYFIKHFEPLVSDKVAVIALQGLSKYYIDNKHERVGASWMTREDRETDIRNQFVYIDRVLKDLLNKTTNKTIKINLLGFSQGTATVTRWATHSKLNFNKLVLWAGTPAHELTANDFSHVSPRAKVVAVIGSQDEYYKTDAWIKELEKSKQVFGRVEAINFEGKHEMNKEALLKVAVI